MPEERFLAKISILNVFTNPEVNIIRPFYLLQSKFTPPKSQSQIHFTGSRFNIQHKSKPRQVLILPGLRHSLQSLSDPSALCLTPKFKNPGARNKFILLTVEIKSNFITVHFQKQL